MTHSGVPALAALTALCFEIFTSYSLRDGSAGASPLFGWELTILDSYWLREFCNIRMLAICSGDSDTRLTQSHSEHDTHLRNKKESIFKLSYFQAATSAQATHWQRHSHSCIPSKF